MFESNGRGIFGVGKRHGAVSDFAVLSVVTSDCRIRAIFWGMGDFGGNVRSGDRAIGKWAILGDFGRFWAIGRSGDRANSSCNSVNFTRYPKFGHRRNSETAVPCPYGCGW